MKSLGYKTPSIAEGLINVRTPEIHLIEKKIKSFKTNVKKVLLIQPLQIAEEKIDIKIALNKRVNNDFVQLLKSTPDYVPSQKELNDLWFYTDYEINYKPIFKQNNRHKLLKLECFLQDISDRMTRDNPLSNYFLNVVKKKLGKNSEANNRLKLARDYLNKSDYWKSRFDILNLEY